ncbi:MAG: hypothetical protein IKN71_00095 [Alphaproteobacteria bacterium]|nr:hypothetical protein [Alphaproteobacteria bacterium]
MLKNEFSSEEEYNSIQKAALASVPLNKVDHNHLPCGIASGFFLKYKNHMFFLTAQHIYEGDLEEKKGRWGIICNWDILRGTLIKPLGQMGFLLSGHFTKKMARALVSPKAINILKANGCMEIDLAYKLTNFIQTEIKLSNDGSNILLKEKRLPLEDNLDVDVDKNETYTFSGYVKPYEKVDVLKKYNVENCYFHVVTPVCFFGLKYTGNKVNLKTGEMLIFEMQDYVEDEYIKGCSGAPILDSKGNLIALVSERHEVKANKYRGTQKKTLIYGLNLKKYKIALDIEINDL